MYSLFTHKGLNDCAPFQLTETIKDYIKIATPKIIIVSPGYLSITVDTTKSLLDDIFSNWYLQNDTKWLGLTAGMNGVNKDGDPQNLDNYWSELKKKRIKIIYFTKYNRRGKPYKTNRDHKKMIFFADFITPDCILKHDNKIDKKNLDDFIGNIRVKAVSTGSSNFSKQTYLGDKMGESDKGESDIFIYSEETNGDNNLFHEVLLKKMESIESQSPELESSESQRLELESHEESSHENESNEEYNIVPPILSQSLKIGNIPSKSSDILSDNLSNDESYLTWMLYETLKDQL